MSFGGEYLFPEAWRKINDTPFNGVLSKTELNRRGAVEFHSKNYPGDDWKAHAGRERQASVFEKMERCRLEPFRGTQGADDPGFKTRAADEFLGNRAAAASNRLPNVRSFVSKELKFQPSASWNTKTQSWDPTESAAAGLSLRNPGFPGATIMGPMGSTAASTIGSMSDSVDKFAASSSGGGGQAETSWQGWDSNGAKDAYLFTRKQAQANRYQTDTPYWSRPPWMRKKN